MLYTPEGLAKLFAYGRWAQDKMFESVVPLSPEEFTRKIGGSFGSIHGTLTHLYGADWVWLERLHGRSPRALPEAQEGWILQDFRDKWKPVEAGHQAFADRVTPEQLASPMTYVNFAGQTCTYSIADALVHVVNHGTYHRGQIATILRQLDHKPIPTDYLRFVEAGG